MVNFEFHSPTRVIFGKGTEETAGAEIRAEGGSRVLLHYGGKSAAASGLLDRVKASLTASGLYYTELGGVVPNPRVSLIREGIEICRRNHIDFILAVGGGSVLDSSKAIGHGAVYDGDVWDFFSGKAMPAKTLPVASVLTIAAAGSETSNSCVVTNDDGQLKRGLNTPLNRPRFAIMDPELTYTLPPYQTACGIVDIMMHTLERYFSPTLQADFVDRISEALLAAVIRAGKMAMANPTDYDARAELMWAGSISHNGLTGTGKVQDFASHQLEHELSGLYNVAHGAGLAAVWPSWARFVHKENPMKFAQYANRVWGISMDFENPEKTALEGIQATEDYYKSLGMPTRIEEFGFAVSDADIQLLSEKCTFFGKRTIGAFMKLGFEEIKQIYLMARR